MADFDRATFDELRMDFTENDLTFDCTAFDAFVPKERVFDDDFCSNDQSSTQNGFGSSYDASNSLGESLGLALSKQSSSERRNGYLPAYDSNSTPNMNELVDEIFSVR